MSATTNPTRPDLDAVSIADDAMTTAAIGYRIAAANRRRAVQRAVAAGATHQEVANVLGCSRVYVTQLVNNQPEETDQ